MYHCVVKHGLTDSVAVICPTCKIIAYMTKSDYASIWRDADRRHRVDKAWQDTSAFVHRHGRLMTNLEKDLFSDYLKER